MKQLCRLDTVCYRFLLRGGTKSGTVKSHNGEGTIPTAPGPHKQRSMCALFTGLPLLFVVLRVIRWSAFC
jgi:hypothetical protein